ncbi:hypothetical protein ACA910_000869 [Epithemia clementina (nom. ined.)]
MPSKANVLLKFIFLLILSLAVRNFYVPLLDLDVSPPSSNAAVASLLQGQRFSVDPQEQQLPQLDHQATRAVSNDLSSAHVITTTARKTRESDSSISPTTPVVFDIISVGSNSQRELQDAQLKTFGSHWAVRNFYRATEADDSESDCHVKLTKDHVRRITNYCRNGRTLASNTRPAWPPELFKMIRNYANFKWLNKKASPMGWMCAQKRPIDAFLNAAKKYNYRSSTSQNQNQQQEQSSTTLPDYVLISDDDTWVNMDRLSQFVTRSYPKYEAHAVAGCMIRSAVQAHNFTIPYGGFGLVLTQQALYNFLRPLNCSASHANLEMSTMESILTLRDSNREDDFEKLACWRVQQNGIGEKRLFRNGMSVADLMQAYSLDSPYTKVAEWGDVGFCLHSDWVWGYFINYYHLSMHSHVPFFANVMHDRLRAYNGSQFYAGSSTDRTLLRQCLNSLDFRNPGMVEFRKAVNGDPFCSMQAHVCHRISPQHMRLLHRKIEARKRQLEAAAISWQQQLLPPK